MIKPIMKSLNPRIKLRTPPPIFEPNAKTWDEISVQLVARKLSIWLIGFSIMSIICG